MEHWEGVKFYESKHLFTAFMEGLPADTWDIGRKINRVVCVDRPVVSVISLTVVTYRITCLL